jgi:hypothetical protein
MYSQINNVNTLVQRSMQASLCRIRRFSRFLGALLVLLLFFVYAAMSESPAVFAAEQGSTDVFLTQGDQPKQSTDPDPLFGSLSQKITKLTDKVKAIATPIAGLCIALVFMMNLGAPVLPEFAQQNKGYVMRALGIVAFVSIIPELITFVSTMT